MRHGAGPVPDRRAEEADLQKCERVWHLSGVGREGVHDVIGEMVMVTAFEQSGDLSGLYAEAIAAINASAATVVSVDIPSGADADVMGEQTGAVARSDAIVTFTAPRPAHIFGLLTTGPIVVSPIGSPEEAIVSSLNLNVITPRDVA